MPDASDQKSTNSLHERAIMAEKDVQNIHTGDITNNYPPPAPPVASTPSSS